MTRRFSSQLTIKKNKEEAANFFAVISFLSFFCVGVIGGGALIKHNPIHKNNVRIELEERRAAIVQKLNRKEQDILLSGIEEAKNFNQEIREEQYKLHNKWTNLYHCPVYDEFEPISYDEYK